MSEEGQRFEVVDGRVAAPFVMVPLWIVFGASAKARALYEAIAAHRNWKTGNGTSWPSQPTLAKLINVQNPKAVRPYLKELATLGAIDIIHRKTAGGLNDSNCYVIHTEPPDGFTGPRTISEYYALEENAGEAVGSSSTPRSKAKNGGKADKNRVRAGGTVGSSSTPRRVPQHPLVGSSSTPEVEEEKLEENPPCPPSHTGTAGSTADDGKAGGDQLREDNDETLIAAVLAVRPGWGEEEIREVLAHPKVLARPAAQRGPALLALAADPATMHPNRLVVDGPWWAATVATVPRPRVKWCGECDEIDRFLNTPDGLAPCPRCHPRGIAQNGDPR